MFTSVQSPSMQGFRNTHTTTIGVRNMIKNISAHSRVGCCIAICLCIVFGMARGALTAEPGLEKTFVRGVYYGNSFDLGAKATGKDPRAFQNQLFHDLRRKYHCNLFWSGSGGIPDQMQTLDIAAKHDLKILVNVRYGYNNFSTPMETEAKMEALAKQWTDALKNHKANAGYVICEEDDQATVTQMDYYRGLFERFDPARPGIFIPCGVAVVHYAYRSGFPILGSESYVWGGPGHQACPKTPESSRDYYINMVSGLGDLSRKSGKPAWMMTQSFAGCDGKYWDDPQGNYIMEAGSQWSTRMPTPGETRFQIWDAVRAGCKGVVFFVLMPHWPNWQPDSQDLSEVEKKFGESMDKSLASLKGRTDVPLLKERTNTGEPATLLKRDGSATRQSLAMAEAFAAIEKLESLIVSWKPAGFPAAFADPSAGINTFESPDRPGRRFVTVVNYDVASKKSLPLLFAPNVTGVTDLQSGANVPLSSPPAEPFGLQSGAVSLEAGDGTILELSFKDDRPGVPLFAEDFTHFGSPLLLENTERINLPFASGVGDYWAVRKVRTPTTGGAAGATGLVYGRQEGPVPCARLTKLQNTAIDSGPLGGSLGLAAQGLCDVFLTVEGTFAKPESLIIETVNKDGQEAWLSSDGHFKPVRIPVKDASGKDVVEVRFILADDALLTGIRCWRVSRNR